jgi:hypothetical protein
MPVWNYDKADFEDAHEHPVPDDTYKMEKWMPKNEFEIKKEVAFDDLSDESGDPLADHEKPAIVAQVRLAYYVKQRLDYLE